MSETTNLKAEAKEHAGDLAEKVKAVARGKAEEHINAMQDEAAGRVDSAADAAEAAAAQFDPASLQAEALRQVADRVEQVANSIRQSDLETVAGQVTRFARRNPILFVGAAAMAGFAVTRFLKAQPTESNDPMVSDPWGSHTYDPVRANSNGDRDDA